MLEFNSDQVAALAEIDAKAFVSRVAADLASENPALAAEPTLPVRLWQAFTAARLLGIERDDNLVAFLHMETYASKFYEQPAVRNWLTRPGRPPDERLHDYFRVVQWKIDNPEFNGGISNGSSGGAGNRGSRDSGRSVAAGWGRLIGWRRRGGNG
ncbi:hypothetical protein JOE11_004982 [Robbsia andropogonis]|uniref:hypothetical protein n=1 Tax=Robbsia andropogonis TaxID=28092 RepID=UPI003D24F460